MCTSSRFLKECTNFSKITLGPYLALIARFICRETLMTHLLWLMEYPVIAENMQKKITNKFCNKIIRIDIFFDKNEREYYLTIALMGTFLRLIILQNQTRGQ